MLSPLEPLKRHADIKATRADNTGTWLLQLQSFCNWRDNTSTLEQTETDRVFCAYGMPGAGKTVLRYLLYNLTLLPEYMANRDT